MSNEDPENTPPSPNARPRRSSLAEVFGGRPTFNASSTTGNAETHKPGSLANAMAQQSRARRLSITTLGLSGSPNGPKTGGFDSLREKAQRHSPVGANEEAIEDEDGVAPLGGETGSRPTSPSLGRRLSFGARAYRDSMRASSGGSAVDTGQDGAGGSPAGGSGGSSVSGGSLKGATPPGSGRKEGFNWSESLRTRAASRSSISVGPGASAASIMQRSGRSQSVAEPGPSAIVPPAPQPKSPPPKAPDHFQERILKGDFYMD